MPGTEIVPQQHVKGACGPWWKIHLITVSQRYIFTPHELLSIPAAPPPPPDSLTSNYSDGCPIWRCIIEGLELELIKENSLVSVTRHFEVAEYLKRAPFLRGNEIQTKSEEEEDFVCFCLCSGAQMEDLE